MSAREPSFSLDPRRLLLPAGCTLLLALVLVRLPVPMEVDPLSAHRAQLYETLRLGHDWAASTATTEGPLAALQVPAYLTGSLWMAVTWQLAGNLLLAALLVAAAWRLAWSHRAWALAALALVLSRWPELAPWLGLALVGHDLVRAWDCEPAAVVPRALLLGFLSLFSSGHLLLAASAVLLTAVTTRPPLARALAAAGFVGGVTGSWLAVGQSLPGLGRWLQFAVPALWSTSPGSRLVDVAPLAPWAAAGALVLGLALLRHPRTASASRRSLPGELFLALTAWLAWRTLALPDHGLPTAFFATLLLAAFILWDQGARTRWVGPLLALGLAGLQAAHPEFLPNAVGHCNRRAITSVRQLAAGDDFRATLRAGVAGVRAMHPWPRLRALVGRAPVGADAAAWSRARLNLPAVVDASAAPEYFVQRLATTAERPPAFIDGPAQLALYRNYALETEENSVLLWHRRPVPHAAPVEMAQGALACGEPLRLPAAPDTGYWLEVEVTPTLLGRLWSLVDEPAEPGVVIRDDHGRTVRYALPAAIGARGFLVDPFIRGGVEFEAWQRDEQPARTASVTVVPPPAGGWLWSAHYHYRLRALPGLKLAGQALASTPPTAFRSFNRRPVGAAYTLPFVESNASPAEALFFVHPDSLVELAVKATDRRVRGHFGIAPGAYTGAGRTDGVDFWIEYVGPEGRREVLLHRFLNPALEPGDRPEQAFDLALPEAAGGRLLLRSSNPSYRSAAWDWAFWRNVVMD